MHVAQWCTTCTYSFGCGLDYVQSFSTTGGVSNITNLNTGCGGTAGYNNFSSTKIHVTQIGSSVGFTIQNNATFGEYYKMWVDFNIDGDFTDAGEEVWASVSKLAGNASYTGTFTVPATANAGMSRLRIRCDYSYQPDPCTGSYEGETEDYGFEITSPCAAPTGLFVNNITSQTAAIGWVPPTPSIGSEYAVDVNPNGPTTGTSVTTTSANVTGLTPNTNYVLHVRNKCNTTSKSIWVHYPFTTLPPCEPPVNIMAVNLTTSSATVKWNKWPSAISYDVQVDQVPTNPTTTTGLTNLTDTFYSVNNLSENTWYYIHVRSKCPGNETSDWGLDSFLTPVLCRAPNIKIDHISTDEAVAYWDPVPTAIHYEYAVTTSATPPYNGTEYKVTSLHAPVLADGKDYYVHVRSSCVSLGIPSMSDWGTASFRTFPVGISNVNGDGGFTLQAYPNPVKNTLNVTLSSAIKGKASITVTDMNGRVVLNMTPQNTSAEVDMSGLPAGLYLLKYTDDEHSSVTRITKL